MSTATEKAKTWLEGNYDEDTKNQILSWMESEPDALEDAFYKDMEFGTGGMRGIMGVGSNRINRYTLGAATQGLSNYLIKKFPAQEIKVAIAYDCRHNSKEYARLVANVFTANMIKVYLFEDLRPTPELSFAVRELGCHSGIVLTASYNPPKYNGYKVYWEDGAQIVSPDDENIIAEVKKIDNVDKIKFIGNHHLIEELGAEMDEAFWKASLQNSYTDAGKESLKIVYTSLHGTSIKSIPEVLSRAGFEHVHIVKEQAVPDGDFPTVKSPNPEEKEALAMAIQQAEDTNSDMVIGADPDADRIGIAARNPQGELQILNGNQTGVLMTDFLIRKWKDKGSLKGVEFIAYTIVSSDLFRAVAEEYGVQWDVCLTGFKHIAKLIRDKEDTHTYIGGGEESYGYMVGDFVRDKDSVTSTLVASEMAAEAKSQGKTLFDLLIDIYLKHGLYQEHLISIVKEGKTGAEKIVAMMEEYRHKPPTSLAGEKIVKIADYQSQELKDLETGEFEKIILPKSNILQFFTEAGSKISARPSGTEPKIKFYFSMRKELESREAYDSTLNTLNKSIKQCITDLGLA